MIGSPPPGAEAQLTFLTKLQRVFSEGSFTATYKFALLIALADLAVELGNDDGEPLEITIRQIADRFIQLYWQQALPYGAGRRGATPGVLLQNNGAQAAVISEIAAFRATAGHASAQDLAQNASYPELLSVVSKTVSAQPLAFLQNFGGTTDEFLYERAGPGRVRLKPGVAYCLRRFQPLVQQLARTHWLQHIKTNRQNNAILGEADDLEQFLFQPSRQSLIELGKGLRKVDGARCFYCEQTLESVDVDHFIPFSQYPRHLAHNFVLAHARCNRSKSDMLAAKSHLERWLARLSMRADDIAEVGQDAGFVADSGVCHRVAAWGYGGVCQAGGSAWVAPGRFDKVDSSYLTLF